MRVKMEDLESVIACDLCIQILTLQHSKSHYWNEKILDASICVSPSQLFDLEL